LEFTRKGKGKPTRFIQPSSVGPVVPTGAAIAYDDNIMTIDFIYSPPRTNEVHTLARVALTPKYAERLRRDIDEFLATVAKAKTEKRVISKKA